MTKINEEKFVCSKDFDDFKKEDTKFKKRVDSKLNKISYLGNKEFSQTLKDIVNERKAYAVMMNKWIKILKPVAIVLGVIGGIVTIIYTINKFIRGL